MLNESSMSVNDSAMNFSQTYLTKVQSTESTPIIAVGYGSTSTMWWTVTLSAIQWLVFVLGTFGNLLVLLVLIWNRSSKQLVTQLYVGSLSLSNLGLLLSSGWLHAGSWIYTSKLEIRPTILQDTIYLASRLLLFFTMDTGRFDTRQVNWQTFATVV